jgi:hypothetical protein
VNASHPESATAGQTARSDGDERARLEALIAAECFQPIPADALLLARHLGERAGVKAMVFYGSGLWGAGGADTVYDFYVLVDRFRDWNTHRALRVAGSVLPPNVYYLEIESGGRKLRCKYAVMRLRQFTSAAAGKSVTPHIWARFSQPCRLLHVRDAQIVAQLVGALADAVVEFHRRTLPLVTDVSIADFWAAGLRSTYRSEIRSEKPGRAKRLTETGSAALFARTRLALPLCHPKGFLGADERVHSKFTHHERRVFRWKLSALRPLQKLVVLGRLIKAGFTFQGGLDYARWKIERHSGVSIPVTDFQRRHPVIAGLFLFLKALRRGGLR